MKMTPMAQGQVAVNPNEGSSAGADRLAKAKAVASGQVTPAAADRGPPPDLQVERAQNAMKKIKMRTQVSPDRHNLIEETVEAAAPVTQDDLLEPNEQAPVVSEETKPLSPQFAALARQKREIQIAQKALDAQKLAMDSQPKDTKSLDEYKARVKANPLRVLQEEGVTYDQLTEAILADDGSADLTALKAEIKALKDGLDNQTKSLTDREAETETQVKAQIRRNVDKLIATGDEFELVRDAGYAPKVVDLIDRVWRAEKILLDESEAATIIENELLQESLKFARLKKVQSSLNPAPAQQPQPVQQDRPNTKIMRTLTNRDGVSSNSLSKRERAIAAMEGRRLK